MKIWTSEIEYVSAQRKATTGKSIIRDENGNFVCVAGTIDAELMVGAVNALATLQHIANYPANGNSEPDVMAAALDDIVRKAWKAIKHLHLPVESGLTYRDVTQIKE